MSFFWEHESDRCRYPNFEVHTYPWPRYTILDSRFPPVMRSRKAGLPFATRAWKRELSIQEVRIENDSDQKFSKTKSFQSFSENHFFRRFMSPWSLWAENIFSIFKSGPGTRGFPYYVRQCPLLDQKTRLLSHKILKRAGHRRTMADKHDETFLQMIKDSSRNWPKIRLNPVPAGYPASKSGSGLKKFVGFLPDFNFLPKKSKKIVWLLMN